MSALRIVREERRGIRPCCSCPKKGGTFVLYILGVKLEKDDGRPEWYCEACATDVAKLWRENSPVYGRAA